MLMGIFDGIFSIFEKNKAHREFGELYSELNKIASRLHKILKELRSIQKLNQKKDAGLSLGKTLFVEEELIKSLKALAEQSEQKFLETLEETRKSGPIDPEEQDQLYAVHDFLKRIEKLVNLKEISRASGVKDKLTLIYSNLMDVTAESKQFYVVQKYMKSLARKIAEHEISPLMRKVYQDARALSEKEPLLVYELTEKDLRKLEKESEMINACRDSRFRIEWRRWWRSIQAPEADKNTPIKDPHINVTMKLFGAPKKEIHLLLKAA